MTRQAIGRAVVIIVVAAFLFVMTSLSMEGRYVPAEWDERLIMAGVFLGLTSAAVLGWTDRP